MFLLILIGAFAGLVMGSVGVGGGAIIILCLSALPGFSQKMAQGTTLFIVAAPISLMAAIRYHQQNCVDIQSGLIVMTSFLVFSYIGAYIATHLPDNILKILLGVMLVLMGTRLIVGGWVTFN